MDFQWRPPSWQDNQPIHGDHPMVTGLFEHLKPLGGQIKPPPVSSRGQIIIHDTKREPGFYWLKPLDEEWVIGEWSRSAQCWFLTGMAKWSDSTEFEKIGPRVDPPKE